jgi:hypothetical protein
MLNTKQVRAIMNKHGLNEMWTNKTTGDTTNIRRVKCYAPHNKTKLNALLAELNRLAGEVNVAMTSGARTYGYGRPGIVVKCVLG